MLEFIKEKIFKCRKFGPSASMWKKIIASAFVFGSSVDAFSLNITAEEYTVCPNEGVILNSSGASSSSVTWQKKVGSSWVNASSEGSQLKAGVAFIYEMDDDDVEFRAIEKTGTLITAISNVVKITKGTNCVPECHTSATGDFITGTDFDPTGANSGKLENDVEHYFPEYGLEFSKGKASYSISNQNQILDKYVPYIDRNLAEGNPNYRNYFMTLENPSNTLVSIRFPANPNACTHNGLHYRDQNYRFVMRAYILPTCGMDGNASFIARTEHGTVSQDRMDVELYDDNTNTFMGRVQDVKSSGGVARVYLRDFKNVNVSTLSNSGHVYRLEITFYGFMPYVNEGLEHYGFTPFFEQFSCTKVAIDYISAEVEKVCLSPKMVCKGETVSATATGFPKTSSYKWYEKDNRGWYELVGFSGDGDEHRTANIPVNFVGARLFKVEVNKGDGGSAVSKEFTVYGKECDPIWPDAIIGESKICAPSAQNVFSVDPVSEDESVFYRWTLITPSGKELVNNTVYDDGTEIHEDAATKGATVKVLFPKVAEFGKYTIQAQVVRRVESSNGIVTDNPIGEPIKKTIEVHNTPDPKIVLSGVEGSAESDKLLCPSDTKAEIKATANVTTTDDRKYIYTWTGASASSKYSAVSNVAWDRDAACSGTMTKHSVSVNVEIEGFGCPASAENSYKFEKLVSPTIDCSKIDGKEFVLGETEKTTTIDLPLPSYTSSCDPDPKMTINIVVKDLYGNELKEENQSRKVSFDMSLQESINKKVVAPAGRVELTYSITDGCGKTESCNAVIKVVDKTAPNVNCDLIKHYTTHLKNQKGCVAVPGDYPVELPKITPTKLKDLNGVDDDIIITYMGRLEKTDEPAHSPSAGFDKTKDLNADYKKGVTWILWEYADKSGNATYCLQSVTVIDDKAPNVTCPEITSLGNIDVDTLTCTLKPSSVIAKLQEVAKLPFGFDECSSTPKDSLVPTLYYRIPKEGDGLFEIKETDMNEPLFETGTKYELVWVFKKKAASFVDTNVSVECAVSFMPEDQDPPEFDCSSLIDIMVYPNHMISNDGIHYDDYASAIGQDGTNPNKTYTLKEYFDEGYLSMHDDVEDKCGGLVTVEVVVVDYNGKERKIQNLTEFQKYRFVGDPDGKKALVYTIKYKFVDARGNAKTCSHTVTVVRNAPPVPNCLDPVVMYADEKCEAIYDLKLDQIPTATVQYFHISRYGECDGRVEKDCSKTTPKTTNSNGEPIKFEAMKDPKASSTEFRKASVFPDSVRLIDANGVVTMVKNPLTEDDKVVIKDVTFRTFLSDGKPCFCDEDVPYAYAAANLTNFKTVPSIVNKYNLPVGENTYVWYFSNVYDKTDPTSMSFVDSCVVKITVLDTISPKLTCGPWEVKSTFYADHSCELSQSQVKVVKPTLSQLEAEDNCTPADELKLSWVRTYNKKKSTDLAAPYKVGLTTIDWIVTDKSGNSDTCTQFIEVLDILGPPVDCGVATPPLTAYADANCLVEVAVMKEHGLQIPDIEDDPCSPTGERIKGEGTRNDGKEVFEDPYPKGETVITWKFTDAAGASSYCEQVITVLDTMKPVFDCREIVDTTVALRPDQCELTLKEVLEVLGDHTAQDNCDGEIKGNPRLRKDDNVEVDLPAKFPKDSTYHIIWHFTDTSNNDKICDQYLTVADTTPPDASEACNNLTDKEVVATETCELPFTALGINIDSSIEDYCDGALKAKVQAFVTQYDSSVVRYEDEEILDVMFPVGKHKFLYIYTDKASLSDTCTMYVTVKDGTPPVLLDCFNGKDTVMGNVSTDVCGLTYEDLKNLIIIPKAYDECDDLANGGSTIFIEPVVKRYFKNIETGVFDLVVDGVDNEEWKVDSFPVGLTQLVFYFSDRSGNTVSCDKFVNVVDARGPNFDCSTLENPIYDVTAPENACKMEFGDIWSDLDKEYWATRSCTDEKILGILTLYGTNVKVPSDYELEVGRDYHLLWMFRSEVDGKVATCDQIIRPNHQYKLEPNCSNAADIDTIKATEELCEVPGNSVITKYPFAIDHCTNDTVWGVPHRSDSLEISDPFPTGHTHITWTMVSIYNVKDTAKCEQDVDIKGNKKFELNCDELAPAMHKVVSGCDPVYLGDTLEVPYADDPCADPDSSYFKRPGEGVRSDKAELDPLADKYNLGQTWIKWTFWDFTHSVKDSCNQLVDVRTTEKLDINCDSIHADTLSIAVNEGECSVDASVVKASLKKRGYPVAKHPCGLGLFEGTPTRPNGLTMDDPFYIGPNEIIWVFIDSTTHTLTDSVAYCTQIVRVGDVNVPPVDCSQMPDTLIVLPEYDCDIEFSELGLDIKPVYDLCSGEHIDSVVTRASLPGMSSQTVDIFSYPFYVGVDTVYWKYDFGSYSFLCKQTVHVKDAMAPVVDCDTIFDDTLILKEGLCELAKEDVLDSIKQPYAYEYCSNEKIKGVPKLMTITGTDTTLSDLPAKFAVGEPYKIAWLFENDSLSVVSKMCDIDLTIMSSTKPKFDCSIYDDTIKKFINGECDVVLDKQILPIPEGEDFCTETVVYGKGYQVDTVAGVPVYTLLAVQENGVATYKKEKLSVGVYKIAWVFESKYSTAKDTCVETLNILTDKKIDLACVELPSFAPKSEDLCKTWEKLDVPVALNPCTGEQILPDTVLRSDKIPFKGVDDTFYVGKTTVTWIFIDHSNTLVDSIETCVQTVQVGDIKDDPIQCPDDIQKTLAIGVCQLSPEDIGLNDSLPKFMDMCADTVVPLNRVWRTSGKAITDMFDLGVDTIVREYLYHHAVITCEQRVSLRNAAIDSFDCTLLGNSNNDTITVELKTAEDFVPFSDVIMNGLVIDFDLHNECGQLDTFYTRSDGKKLGEPYPLGLTKIILTVRDTTHENESTKTCQRFIKVINTGNPDMVCPPLTYRKYICHNDLPQSYKTFEEFVNAGGKFMSRGEEVPELVDPTTFKVDSVIYDVLNNKVTTVNICEYTLIRTYSAIDVRNQNVTPCSDTFRVKDSVPPVWIDDAVSTIENFACTPTTPFSDGVLKAKDNCWEVVYDKPVQKTAGVPLANGIFYSDSTNRSADPTSCEYYNYDIIRRFVAYDACNNHSDTLTYIRQIRDNEPPKFDNDIVSAWLEDMIMADYDRPCIFKVPDVDGLLPPDAIVDNCDPNATQYFKHTQIPPKGTVLNTNSGYVDVKIIIEDPCGLKDSLIKKVTVPTRNSIVDEYMRDTTVCGEDNILLSNPIISGYTGSIWQRDWFTDEWSFDPTRSVVFDYYKDSIAEENLLFSNNEYTYAWKFNQQVGGDELLALKYYTNSGRYWVVATDTVRFCRDTATAIINIHESPNVSLVSEIYTICENDSLHLVSEDESLYDRFQVYVFDNGYPVTEEGWLIDDVRYEPNSKVSYSSTSRTLKYYAKNFCGTSSSFDGVVLNTRPRMNPENLMLTTKPQDKPRVFKSETAELKLLTKYSPYEYHWYKVIGDYDGRFEESYSREGEINEEYKHLINEPDSLIEIKYLKDADCKKLDLYDLQDSASYYVVMIDSVCPAVPSNVVSINVVKDLPTAFTPMNSVGLNDTFMEGYPVVIFNRYGQKMVESQNGWDGKCRGEFVDPGVYFYEVILNTSEKHKGSIEVVYFK